MMRLFGGFPRVFWQVYREAYPIPEEVERALPRYQVYYLLAHVHFFGEGYLGALMEGDFRLLGPIDLLQLLAHGGKTGAFLVEGGEVYLEGGRPVHASYQGKKAGKEALLAILWP
jgi:GNAT superfamily N-acetyltransferase